LNVVREELVHAVRSVTAHLLAHEATLRRLERAFFTSLFERAPAARDMFEDAVGASEWRKMELLRNLLTFVVDACTIQHFTTSERFIERAHGCADIGIRPSLYRKFNEELVKAMQAVLGPPLVRLLSLPPLPAASPPLPLSLLDDSAHGAVLAECDGRGGDGVLCRRPTERINDDADTADTASHRHGRPCRHRHDSHRCRH